MSVVHNVAAFFSFRDLQRGQRFEDHERGL